MPGLSSRCPRRELTPPEGDEVYLHELAGFSVRLPDDTPLGLVSAVYELPAGLMIEVQGPKREFLLPYRKEFVREVDRAGRRLLVTPPEGWWSDMLTIDVVTLFPEVIAPFVAASYSGAGGGSRVGTVQPGSAS